MTYPLRAPCRTLIPAAGRQRRHQRRCRTGPLCAPPGHHPGRGDLRRSCEQPGGPRRPPGWPACLYTRLIRTAGAGPGDHRARRRSAWPAGSTALAGPAADGGQVYCRWQSFSGLAGSPAGRRRRVHLAAARRFFTRAVAAGMGPAEVKTDGVPSAYGFSASCSDGAVHRRAVREQPDRGRSRTA